MRYIYYIIALIAMLDVSGCSRTSVTNRVSVSDYNGDPRRIFITAQFDLRFSADGFSPALQVQLSQCGIDSVVVSPSKLQLDADLKARQLLAGFNPDAIMTVRLAGVGYEANVMASATYLVTVADVQQKREIWKGLIAMRANWFELDRTSVAASMATTLVKRLTEDGILKACAGSGGKPV